jgi:hypothetical protein
MVGGFKARYLYNFILAIHIGSIKDKMDRQSQVAFDIALHLLPGKEWNYHLGGNKNQQIDRYLNILPEPERLRCLEILTDHLTDYGPTYNKIPPFIQYLKYYLQKYDTELAIKQLLEPKLAIEQQFNVRKYLNANEQTAWKKATAMPRPAIAKDVRILKGLIKQLEIALQTEPFVKGVVKAIEDKDKDELDLLFLRIPKEYIPIYIKLLVHYVRIKAYFKDNTNLEVGVLNAIQEYFDTLLKLYQHELTPDQIQAVRDLYVNVKTENLTGILDPNIRIFRNRISEKNSIARRYNNYTSNNTNNLQNLYEQERINRERAEEANEIAYYKNQKKKGGRRRSQTAKRKTRRRRN